MPANVKGALVIALGYLAMIAAAAVIVFYIKKANTEIKEKPEDKYDLGARITSYVFKDLFKK